MTDGGINLTNEYGIGKKNRDKRVIIRKIIRYFSWAIEVAKFSKCN